MDDLSSNERVLAAAEVTPLLLRYTFGDLTAHTCTSCFDLSYNMTFMQCLLQGGLTLREEGADIGSSDSPH